MHAESILGVLHRTSDPDEKGVSTVRGKPKILPGTRQTAASRLAATPLPAEVDSAQLTEPTGLLEPSKTFHEAPVTFRP
jgi:hypothetical protein